MNQLALSRWPRKWSGQDPHRLIDTPSFSIIRSLTQYIPSEIQTAFNAVRLGKVHVLARACRSGMSLRNGLPAAHRPNPQNAQILSHEIVILENLWPIACLLEIVFLFFLLWILYENFHHIIQFISINVWYIRFCNRLESTWTFIDWFSLIQSLKFRFSCHHFFLFFFPSVFQIIDPEKAASFILATIPPTISRVTVHGRGDNSTWNSFLPHGFYCSWRIKRETRNQKQCNRKIAGILVGSRARRAECQSPTGCSATAFKIKIKRSDFHFLFVFFLLFFFFCNQLITTNRTEIMKISR